MKLTLIIILSSFIYLNSYSQLIYKPGTNSWIVRETNIVYNSLRSEGWKTLDSTFNNRLQAYHLLYRCSARWGWYNPDMDIYLILGTSLVRGRYESDSAANHYYLSEDYLLKQGELIPLQENLVCPAMLKKANVDAVASYKIRLDTPFLKKYHYAKRFLLHKQDVANVTLNFIALNENKEQEINKAFEETWGIISFRPDSVYDPQFVRNALIGKFRHLRPQLNTGDSSKDIRNRKRMYYDISIFNGKAALKAGKEKQAKKDFLAASQILPENASPIKNILMMYLGKEELDSAAVYLTKLQKKYLPQNPKLLSGIKYGQALWYEKKGRYDSAIVVSKELLQLRPKNAFNIYSGIGDNYQKKGDYKAALEAYKKAQQTYQSSHHRFSASYNYKIGECYEKLSNRQQAKKYYTQAQAGGYSLPEEVKEEFGL